MLAGERLLVLEAHPFKVNWAIVKSNHHAVELASLKFNKREPSRVTVLLKTPEGSVDPGRVFHIPDHAAFVSAVQACVRRLHPG